MSCSIAVSSRGILRHSAWDALLVALAVLHGLLLWLKPSIAVVALGLWWNANTISHNFIHLPFFRRRELNLLFSAYLSLILGLPQTLWRDRHLAHHADRPWTLNLRPQLVIEATLVLILWLALWRFERAFFLFLYLPGYALGLGLCFLQGHFEHYAGTASHYSRCYNLLFFNDGFHVEHHRTPGRHWRTLPALSGIAAAPAVESSAPPSGASAFALPVARSRRQGVLGPARVSRWPAVLRWIELINLDGLERLVLRSPMLQDWVVRRHECALRRLWKHRLPPRRIVVVGGGLFPRTALILRRVWPEAEVTIVESNAEHIQCARKFLGSEVHFECAHYDPTSDALLPSQVDLLIVPLAFHGAREAVYAHPPAAQVLVHDWLWRRKGETALISIALLKRMNLVEQ